MVAVADTPAWPEVADRAPFPTINDGLAEIVSVSAGVPVTTVAPLVPVTVMVYAPVGVPPDPPLPAVVATLSVAVALPLAGGVTLPLFGLLKLQVGPFVTTGETLHCS